MAYEAPPIVEVELSDLHLDKANYRIEEVQPSEQAVRNHLYVEQDVPELASLILREGYIDIEVPLVVQEDGVYVVLEGNRRVTALQTLLDPSLVPAHQAEIERLLTRFEAEAQGLPTAIRVMIIGSRVEATSILARLHIGNSKKRWGVDEQARFVVAQIEAGWSIERIRRELPGIKNPLDKVRQHWIRQMLREAPFENPKISTYASGSSLPMTAFEYAYGSPEVREIIGLEFDKDGRMTSKPSTPDQLSALERLVGLFMDRELNTRTFPRKTKDVDYQERIDYLRKYLRGEIAWNPTGGAPATPIPSGAGAISTPAVSGSETNAPPLEGATQRLDSAHSREETSPPTASRSMRGPNNPDTKTTLVISVDYSEVPSGLQKRFGELRAIAVDRFPVASTMLMRLVLEATIKYHYRLEPARLQGKRQLGDVLGPVVADYGSHTQVRNAVGLLSKVKQARNQRGSADWFNTASHDAAFEVKGQDVRDAWLQLEPLVGFLITQVAGPASAP
ncbi:hypothetical protein [Myceligenerans crystallogenes]|uniref:ParB/Sulfiredoxin domain-containing protein n=1 Tax=Myceligenerans crystallogenes TaxID=316335 RepID=A0ABN2ND93_9MICO